MKQPGRRSSKLTACETRGTREASTNPGALHQAHALKGVMFPHFGADGCWGGDARSEDRSSCRSVPGRVPPSVDRVLLEAGRKGADIVPTRTCWRTRSTSGAANT